MANDLVPVDPEPEEYSQEALNDAVVEAADDFLITAGDDLVSRFLSEMTDEALEAFNTLLAATARARGVDVTEEE